MINKIREMHDKFGLTAVPFTPEEKVFRITAMQEELDEYVSAKTPVDELDALVDLVVFALGTADRQGWSSVFEEAYNRVMASNLTKEVGQNQKRNNFQLDLVKPQGFKSADLTDLV